MRHRKNTVKLGRTSSQREALFASLVSNLILAKRITTNYERALTSDVDDIEHIESQSLNGVSVVT